MIEMLKKWLIKKTKDIERECIYLELQIITHKNYILSLYPKLVFKELNEALFSTKPPKHKHKL